MVNYVLPDYFFEKVADRLSMRRDDVETVYNAYLSNLSKALEKEGNIYMTGLGTITAQTKGLVVMYKALNILNKHYRENEEPDQIRCLVYIKRIETVWQKMRKVEKKYEYIKGSLEKFRSNLGRFEELFDNNGYYRGDSKEKKGDM